MKRLVFGVALGLVFSFAVAATHAQQPPIYSQSPISPKDNIGGMVAYSSDTDTADTSYTKAPNGREDFRVYDNFRFKVDHVITDVHWWGTYDSPVKPSSLDGFKIAFWADNAGQPSLVASSVYTIGGTAQETYYSGDGNVTNGYNVFSYAVTLSSPFAAVANTTYWMSIVGAANAATNQEGLWQWWFSDQGLAGLHQDTDVPKQFLPWWNAINGNGGNDDGVVDPGEGRNGPANLPSFFPSQNVAFQLTGREGAIPEPASIAVWALLLSFCGGLGYWRRSKRG